MESLELSNLSEEEKEAILNEEMGEFCRYLVTLAGLRYDLDHHQEPRDPATPFFCSGFLLSLDERWYLVTAGHVLKNMEEAVREGRHFYEGFKLVDCYGSRAPHKDPIPFDFDAANKVYQYDEENGLDYALIAISPLYQKLLEANNVIAIREPDWERWKRTRYKDHFMLGFQKELIEQAVVPGANDYLVRGQPVPTFIYVHKLRSPPANLRKTKYPRFVGQVGPNDSVGNLAGMSGGPIFGVTSKSKHGIVAIQSAWLPTSRVIFGCPIGTFTKLAKDHLLRHRNEG